ncbi:hypothetical protein BD779DRAFT_313123 [Infundibulicybe gibba]|nr:hypothetical protein BD779DRAFT_313123 [Infundibulicybe gibba]
MVSHSWPLNPPVRRQPFRVTSYACESIYLAGPPPTFISLTDGCCRTVRRCLRCA